MPISFLTVEQEHRHGRYIGEPSAEQLVHCFHLDDADRTLIATRRWDHMRLGFALQLGIVRFLGTFLNNPADVPSGVVADLARQLGITDPGCLARYGRSRSRFQHATEIRAHYGYREFTDPAAGVRLTRWRYALCWTGSDRPGALVRPGRRLADGQQGPAAGGDGTGTPDRPRASACGPAALAHLGPRSDRVERDGSWTGERLFRHFKTGEIIPVLTTVFPVQDAAGELIGFGSVTRDVREQRRTEERQAIVNAEIAHRLKNTLAMMQSIAGMTLRKVLPPQELARSDERLQDTQGPNVLATWRYAIES